MHSLESSLHLFQPPMYSNGMSWGADFQCIADTTPGPLTLDVAAIAGILSFNYPTGDRTLFENIHRQPWLSTLDGNGAAQLEAIPPHGFKWDSAPHIAKTLFDLLVQEAEFACAGRKEIYLLLSGGLDSRIVAGVVGQLYQNGKLLAKPVGVTWGLENSRDVQYARRIAALLGFDWQHVSMKPEMLLDNIHEGFSQIGGLVPPSHLHAMHWFRNVSKDAIVLAGSYGDSIGRAEFSGRHLLELDHLRASNPYGLLKRDVLPMAVRGISEDLDRLKQRAPEGAPWHARCEHQMQGFYMRNMIAHVMGIINQHATLYQMFTAPQVYGYMWSLHPARRDDSIYAALLENHLPDLARIPWARTNRALHGKTVGADPGLQKEFHDYAGWSSGPLYADIASLVDPEWFEATGVFNPDAVRGLTQSLSPGSTKMAHLGNRPYDHWLWLAGFRVLYRNIVNSEQTITDAPHAIVTSDAPACNQDSRSSLRRRLSGYPMLYKLVSKVRRWILKRVAIRRFPPEGMV